MANMKASFPLFFLLLLLHSHSPSVFLGAMWAHFPVKNSSKGCNGIEREALFNIKESLNDPFHCLSSWVGKDCCNWVGVRCHKQTGKVIRLHLRGTDICSKAKNISATDIKRPLSGKLNPSLLDLKHLNYLDLSHNDFDNTEIPSFLGSLSKLSYLNLSFSSFAGMVPPQLGNLSNLKYLSLDSPSDSLDLWASDLSWLSGLTSLQYLDMSQVNLSRASNIWQQVVKIRSLSFLDLSNCGLSNLPPTLPSVNFTSLSTLDLSQNNFDSQIPRWLSNVTSLKVLNFGGAGLRGPITELAWGNLCNLQNLDMSFNRQLNGPVEEFVEALAGCTNISLEVLDLGFNELTGKLPNSLGLLYKLRKITLQSNKLSGSIPSSIGNLSHLTYFDLSNNTMNGSISENIGQLTELSSLKFDRNFWRGDLSGIHFQNLTRLSSFSISSNRKSLTFKLTQNWVPSFNLVSLEIYDCQLGPLFPSWLSTQSNLKDIVLQDTGLSDVIPDWFWNFSAQITDVDVSHNNLRGILPKTLRFKENYALVDLGFNSFEGSIPIWSGVIMLSIKNNLLSGSIPSKIGQGMSSLEGLDLSGNLINGTIPSSIGQLTDLSLLDLSNNKLSGKIPVLDKEHHPSLMSLVLSGNNLQGEIPAWMCSTPSLRIIQLSDNNLSGDLSSTLQNCIYLEIVNLGDNNFFGTIPEWLGQNLTWMGALRLRGNELTGNIPESLCHLSMLHVLDLANNKFSGHIPPCLGKMPGFDNKASSPYYGGNIPSDNFGKYVENLDLFTKGRTLEYSKRTWYLVNLIDLSKNNLSGEIPQTLTELSYLGSLNLSWNQLTGNIPANISAMHQLESLDLSCNHLSGKIPPDMASMTFLSHLNLSYNNLSGEIPVANQFQTFAADPSIYEGNPQLCGTPLPTMCTGSTGQESKSKHNDDKDKDLDKLWFYLSIALGYMLGFWVVCGSLVIKASWRYAYFRFIDAAKDRILVVLIVNWARLQRKFKPESN